MDKEETRIKLRKYLKELLKNENIQNCFMTSDDTMQFPYTVLDIKEGTDEIYAPFYLEAETWAYGNDTTELEKICDKLKDIFDEHQDVLETFAIKIYYSGCVTNYDENKDIKRRMQTFDIRMYEFDKED